MDPDVNKMLSTKTKPMNLSKNDAKKGNIQM